MDNETREQEILDHYIQLWGKPMHRFRRPLHKLHKLDPLTVLEFTSATEDKMWTYATVGMSRQPTAYPPGPSAGMELFIFSNQEQPDLADSVAALAAYPLVHQTFFGEGHTIAGQKGVGIVTGSPLTDILLTRAEFGEDQSDYIQHSDGSHTHLFWIVPLYTTERVWAVKQGWTELIKLFEQQQTDVLNLWRPEAALPSERD